MNRGRRIILWGSVAVALVLGWFALVFAGSLVIQSRVPVNLPMQGSHVDLLRQSAARGYVLIEGTFIIEGQKSATPLQTTTIECYRQASVCRAATARLVGIPGGRPFLRVEQDSYPIKVWSETQIVFADDSPQCVSYRFTVDLITGKTAGVRSRKTSTDSVCNSLDESLSLTLADGFAVTRQLEKEAEPIFLKAAAYPIRIFSEQD